MPCACTPAVAALQSFRHAVGPVPVLTKALYASLGALPELFPGSGWRDFKAQVTLSAAAWAELDFWHKREGLHLPRAAHENSGGMARSASQQWPGSRVPKQR